MGDGRSFNDGCMLYFQDKCSPFYSKLIPLCFLPKYIINVVSATVAAFLPPNASQNYVEPG